MTKFINIVGIVLSLVTATGIFIHDARIDKATNLSTNTLFKRTAATTTDASMSSDLHTHPERSQRTLNGFTYQSPSIQPRENKSKRYLMQNAEPRGRHAFDNYNLPVIA
ncbi:MAG TPA: hypothetical protein VL362_00340 [Patescibacteria group bacterium]|nr:hypothetical protein [Patescibacteria group bacterium]